MKDIGDVSTHFYLKFRYQIPGVESKEDLLTVAVCQVCAKESDDPKLFPIIEALTNMNIIRMEHEELMFTPSRRGDE